MSDKRRFYKEHTGDRVWWVADTGVGEFVFSFDKKRTFNLFRDYPHELTQEQRDIFDRENPEWAEFFTDRGAAYGGKVDV